MATKKAKQMVRLADYHTSKEAAEVIGCSDRAVRQMVGRGDISEESLIRLNPRLTLIHRREVERIAKTPQTRGRPRKKLAS